MTGASPIIPEPPVVERDLEPLRMHVVTWGCQMNAYDSDRMADVMAATGYAPAGGAAEAELLLLNTCHIRDRAAEKLFSELGRLRVLKQERARAGRKTVIAVAGCVAQAEGAELVRRAPFVDVVVGPQTYHRLPELVAQARAGSGPVIDTELAGATKFDVLERTAPRGPGATSAFLTVQEGCDKFCAFCVVPYTRGVEESRPVVRVLEEARRLVERGALEITLLGQNVNAYHGVDDSGRTVSLAGLVRLLAERLPGLARIRYTTSHPLDMTADLIAAHAEVPALMPFLHLPVQSGSDRVLRAMNRRHDAQLYRDVVERLRTARPDIALSSDFIVGHPGETDRDFADTLRLVREVGFAQAYSFKYSPRPGTPAATRDGVVEEGVKDARLAELQSLLREQARAFNADMVGRRIEVLFTGAARHPGQVAGRSPWLQPVHVSGPSELIGRIVTVMVMDATASSLAGRLTRETEPA